MKILILRFSAIGDIVLTSPVIRCLKEQLQADIHYATKSAFADIPACNPGITLVYALGKRPGNDHSGIVSTESLRDLINLLKKERYDYIIDLHHNLRTLRIKAALGVKAFSFDKLNFEKWLLVNTGINRLPHRHIVHRYMDTVSSLGVQYDGKGLDFHLPLQAVSEVDDYFRQHQPALSNTPYIALVIGATHFTKRLPEEQLISLCSLINQPIILLGGKAESTSGSNIAKAAGNHVINWCGALSLFGSAEVVKRSKSVITHDTGLMHIAAAFGKKITAVWGNTIPEFGMYPFYPDENDQYYNLQVSGLSCRPCSKIGFDHCPKGHFKCMKNIDLAVIAEKNSP